MRSTLMALFCMMTLKMQAQIINNDSSKTYLGILTLAEKYRNDAAWDLAAQEVVQKNFVRLQELNKKGQVTMAGRTQYETNNPDMMGLVIFKAKNDNEALLFMQNDPAVKAGIMLTKVHPYAIAIGKCTD